jgi:hypothetical protein
MRTTLKLMVFAAALFGLFLIVSFLAFYQLLSVGEFRRFLISEIEQNTNFNVRLGEAQLEVGRFLGVGFHDVALSEPGGAEPVITAERITARVALMPLLRRKLVFYEIHLNQPGALVVRDKDGKIPLLDRLLNLPFLMSAERQFAFDLRALKMTGAKIDLLDQYLEGTARSTRLEKLDLDLRRLRGAALRDFFRSLVRRKRDQPQGTALEFDSKPRWRRRQGSPTAGQRHDDLSERTLGNRPGVVERGRANDGPAGVAGSILCREPLAGKLFKWDFGRTVLFGRKPKTKAPGEGPNFVQTTGDRRAGTFLGAAQPR